MFEPTTATSTRALWRGLLLVLIVAAGLRLWRIDSLPPGFHFDESFEGLEAWRILTDPGYRPVFLTGNFGVPPLNAYANALMFRLFDLFGAAAGPTAMRTTAALFGLLGVLSVFALGDELRRLDQRLSSAFPLLAAAALAVMRWHVHFSRMGIEPVIVPLIWAAATWLLLRGWRTGAWLSFAGSGSLLAAGMYTYQGAWVIPLLMVPTAALLMARTRQTRGDGKLFAPHSPGRRQLAGMLLTAGVALLLFLPLARFFLHNLELVFLRPAQLAVVGETGSPADQAVWVSVVNTFKMFWPLGATGDWDPRRNLPGAPALDLWLALPLFLGLAVALRRVRQTATALVLLGWVGLLLPGMFSEYAPHFHRILGAAAPTALLIGVGLDTLWQWPWLRRRRLQWVVVLLLAASLVTTARDYFVRWAALPDLYYAFDAGMWEAGNWIAQQPSDASIYISPRGLEHATLAFAVRPEPGATDAPAPVVAYDGRHVFPLTNAVVDQAEHYVAIEHEDFRTPLLLPEVFPHASIARELQDANGAIYARIYTRPAGESPQRPPRVSAPQQLADGIALAGYDLLPETAEPGGVLYLQLHWLVSAPPTGDWTVFTHLVNPATGAVVAGKDSTPGNGSLPTPRWQTGWRILDEYQINLPADLPPGDYDLGIGLYDAAGARIPPAGDLRIGQTRIGRPETE